MAWHRYLKQFHGEHAAITEQVLSRCADRDGGNPYDWLLEAVPPAEAPVPIRRIVAHRTG